MGDEILHPEHVQLRHAVQAKDRQIAMIQARVQALRKQQGSGGGHGILRSGPECRSSSAPPAGSTAPSGKAGSFPRTAAPTPLCNPSAAGGGFSFQSPDVTALRSKVEALEATVQEKDDIIRRVC